MTLAVAVGCFTHMPMLPTSNCTYKASVVITIGKLYLVFLLGKCINDKKKRQVERKRSNLGSTGPGGGGPDPGVTKIIDQPPQNAEDGELLDNNTFAFDFTPNQWLIIFLFLILLMDSTCFKSH
ncbi:hypothetical protein KIW84_056591 [Lathyrus oleraceus]|uniref:Uncharacterized protein n=1 Tax=Pisum sativum TaxID=3888 RepID=A0A9D4X0X9_PEA|nr:hypothetical protein KIW84_056591 [Pisum sativum]